MAALFMSVAAVAQDGLTPVGANIAILPSSRWSKAQWEASVLVAGTDWEYGEWSTENTNYNMLVLEDGPAADANGVQWFEKGYDESTPTEEYYGITEDGLLKWQKATAPFSSDEYWNGQKSFQWTRGSIIADIYIRRTFTTNNLLSGPVYLACGHDDAPCEYYLNGELIWSATGWDVDYYEYLYDIIDYDEEGKEIYDTVPYDSIPHYKNGWNDSEYYELTEEQKNLIRIGGEENLLAVHVHQNWGGAFADCGIYTKVEGGLEMGYVQSWEGKVIYNSYGGYNYKGNNDKHELHNWEKLYEAQEGDVYTVHMKGSSEKEEWGSQMHFKTPIALEDGMEYIVKFKLNATSDYTGVRVKMCDNDNDGEELTVFDDFIVIGEGEETEFEETVTGVDGLKNFKLVFDFAGGEPNSDIQISDLAIIDEDGNDLWVGTHFFNYFYMTRNEVKYYYTEWEENPETGETIEKKIYVDADDPRVEDEEYIFGEIAWPVVDGRTETMAWTMAEFDDEQWDTWTMPVGNNGYMPEVKTVWPGGENTNLWVRRNFELDKINPRLSYALNVCHDDNYETYVNGHLLQKNTGWTNGKNPVQVHIPAKFLNVGKNVIATYIQQNWGGKFYDCGINVEEVNYQECRDALLDVIALAEGPHDPLTKKMESDLAILIAEAQNELATNMDAAEIKEYAKNLKPQIEKILGYAQDVKIFRQTVALCEAELKGEMAAVAADAKANVDTCANPDQMRPMLAAMRVARKVHHAERHDVSKFHGTEPEAYGEYYILNVKDGRFLGGAEAWGAHAATEYASNAFALLPTDRDGNELEKGFRIETFRPNGNLGVNDFLGYNAFVDCNVNDAWDFIPVEGKENVYNIVRASVEYEEYVYNEETMEDELVIKHTNMREDGSLYYMGIRLGGDHESNNKYSNIGFNSWNVADTDMTDPANEANQWMFITYEELCEMMETATPENPVDASHFIVNPSFDQRLSIDSWINGSISGGTGVWGRGGNYVDFVWENWNTDYAEVSQVIYDLPEGYYYVDVQGYYRDGHYTTHMYKVDHNIQPERRASVFAFLGEDIFEAEEIVKSTICSFSDGINKVPGMGRRDDYNENVIIGHNEDGEEIKARIQGDGEHYATDACWSAAEEYFQNGLYKNRLLIYVPEGSPLTIGAMKEDTDFHEAGDWLVVDNFRLKYLGLHANAEELEDGVTTVAPVIRANATIYNLAGQRMNKAVKGVNIIGGKKIIK